MLPAIRKLYTKMNNSAGIRYNNSRLLSKKEATKNKNKKSIIHLTTKGIAKIIQSLGARTAVIKDAHRQKYTEVIINPVNFMS